MSDVASDLVAAMREAFAPRLGRVSPSAAWGVFAPGGLVHAEGSGDAAARPADTAFRIASCTKAFTASAAMLLVDEGVLDLDEPLADALDVPLRILGDAASAVGDAPPTVGDALGMRAGFPTDDPWADRQESLSDEAFGAMLAEGVRAQWPAGARYEYSNLGYAIVGRILALRARRPFRELVVERLLRPLGLEATGFTADVAAAGGVVAGFRRASGGWEPCPFSGPGAFSPIGGLFSTVGDLARWCTALVGPAATLPAFVGRALADPGAVISGDPASGPWSAYGMGLVVRDDGTGRRILGHSGGYPGFGARVEWDAASGVGAVALENATYAASSVPVREAFDRVFGADPRQPAPPAAPASPMWEATRAAAEAVRDAMRRGDGLGPRTLYDPCVGLDAPFDRREAELASAVERIGGVAYVSDVSSDAPARASWTLAGPRGTIRASLSMTPRATPSIQALRIVVVD